MDEFDNYFKDDGTPSEGAPQSSEPVQPEPIPQPEQTVQPQPTPQQPPHDLNYYKHNEPQQPQQIPPQYQQQPRPVQPSGRPQYDAFMYEPIGFEQPQGQPIPQQALPMQPPNPKKKHFNRERAFFVAFVLLVIITLVIGVGGIVLDIASSGKRMAVSPQGSKVVIYQEKKPKNAVDMTEYKDENGRYSTEGAAAAVKDSIVEIFTYSDESRKTLIGTGSGVILNEDGYIVTNAHVLDANGFHDVKTTDGKTYNAKVIGRDSKTDIAVIKIKASNISPATLGDSDEVMVGEQVIAIGNPAGLSNSVTDGIVSAVNREIRSDSTGFKMKCIQTNAAISPGNSGGALVNMYGQVIGITSSKYISSYYEGLGFAITINEALPIIEELIDNGYVGGRFRIGITLMDIKTADRRLLVEEEIGCTIPDDFEGIYISDISKDSDIYNTKLEVGDFITKINGKPVSSYDDLYETISASFGAGDTVPATCAHIDKDGKVEYYDIKFKLMEDTSGNY